LAREKNVRHYIVSQRSPKPVIDPLPIKSRIITDKDRLPFNVLGKPSCKVREHFLFLIECRLPAWLWNRRIFNGRIRFHNVPVEGLFGGIEHCAELSQLSSRWTTSVCFTINK